MELYVLQHYGCPATNSEMLGGETLTQVFKPEIKGTVNGVTSAITSKEIQDNW
uniref:Uncharacterized protein n=1 Tax=Arion vulgaris TaxID=1028688 RepID=A0A0B7AP82_9EUPU